VAVVVKVGVEDQAEAENVPVVGVSVGGVASNHLTKHGGRMKDNGKESKRTT